MQYAKQCRRSGAARSALQGAYSSGYLLADRKRTWEDGLCERNLSLRNGAASSTMGQNILKKGREGLGRAG